MDLETKEKILFIAMILVGIGFIVGGFFAFKESLKFKDNAIETKAEVTSVYEHTDSDGEKSYKVYISYDVNGKKYNGSFSESASFRKGQNIKIYYDKNNPKEFSRTQSKIEGVITLILGVAFCVGGFVLLKKN